MAVELCPESSSSLGVGPRISFSYDFGQQDIVPIQHPCRAGSRGSVDFDFCVVETVGQEASSADELFSDGKILPTQIKKKATPPRELDSGVTQSGKDGDGAKESKSVEGEEKQNPKSFWRFKRSSSLNCGSGYAPSLCPLPLLSRSNSTGSAPNGVKREVQTQKQHHSHKHAPNKPSSYHKPPLKKSYANGVRVEPFLNVPSHNLFGLGSIFSGCKCKNKKKGKEG